MRRLLILLTLTLSFASAANFGPENIKGVSLCFTTDSVQLSKSATALIPEGRLDIYEKITTKLRAYRVPVSSVCKPGNVQLYLQIETIVSNTGVLAYVLDMDIYNDFLSAGAVGIYNTSSLGVSPDRGQNLVDHFAQTFGNMTDNLAAYYATANP